jgi:hypothetical protein
MSAETWVSVESLDPVLTFVQYGRSPNLQLNADAQHILAAWNSPVSAPLRVTIVRSENQPTLIAVGLDPYGVSLDVVGRASAARFVKKLGIVPPLTVKLKADELVHLLIGTLPTTKEPPMPLQLPPLENIDQTSVRGIIRAVSTLPLPAETVEYEDTEHEDDDEGDDDDAED